jgi:hypothetical protein
VDKIIIWGLKNKHHSHRFIHKGFYENFKKLGYKTEWVDDSPSNNNYQSDLVFASGIAINNLHLKENTSYIFHNVDFDEKRRDFLFKNRINYINLQVFTKDAKGILLDNESIKLDEETKTLYQPWGTPLDPDEWWPYQPKNQTRFEWWVGAIWNNQLNQGNEKVILDYRKLLRRKKIFFARRGGSKFNKDGLSEKRSAKIIRNSKYGATIVGNWQYEFKYIPCRLFKNLSYGLPILSNMDKPNFLNSPEGFKHNLNSLLDFADNESERDRMKRFLVERNEISNFTYTKNINRLLKILKEVN